MFWRMTTSLVLCLSLIAAVSEGFFLTGSIKKQSDCARRSPTPAAYHSPLGWVSPHSTGNNNSPANPLQPVPLNYPNSKDYGPYQPQNSQQLPQDLQHLPQQQQQLSPHQQQIQNSKQQPFQNPNYQQNVPLTAPKYEPSQYQPINQPQYGFDGTYTTYSQGMQLVPCLCPVNKEILEQQNQQSQQLQQPNSSPQQTQPLNSLTAASTAAAFPSETNNGVPAAST